MEVKTIYMIHHLMYIYGKTTETYLKDNQKIFDEELDNTMIIGNYFDRIDDCINYEYDGNKTYTAAQIINTAYYTVLTKGIYTDPRKMWQNNPASEKNMGQLQEVLHGGAP